MYVEAQRWVEVLLLACTLDYKQWGAFLWITQAKRPNSERAERIGFFVSFLYSSFYYTVLVAESSTEKSPRVIRA